MKRVLTIQDISCIGKCSLTVALPIISALGHETAILPTAILSTHTQFKNPTFRDLTGDLDAIKEHWVHEDFTFDGIYTGYLGSTNQINIVKDYISTFKHSSSCKVIVDPVMADDGKLYSGFPSDFPEKMCELIKEADIILPNISEAALLTGLAYPGESASEEQIKEMLLELGKITTATCIITGVTFKESAPEACSSSTISCDTFGFIGYNPATAEFFSYGAPKINYRSHGTGDIFASTFTGAVLKDIDTYSALKLAADYTSRCIKNTAEDINHVTYGVNFEAELPYLINHS